MKKTNFENIAKYIRSGALFSCRDVDGASSGLVVLWNPNKITIFEIFQC